MTKYRIQTDEPDNTLDIIKTAISAEIKRLEIGLHKTERMIASFEKKYRISSGIFLQEGVAENLEGGDQEYIEWTGELKIRDRIAADLQKLRDIEYVAR